MVNGRREAHPMHTQVSNGRMLQLTHVESVVPQLREARALVNVHELPHPLLDALLFPEPPREGAPTPVLAAKHIPPSLREHLKQSYNPVQLQVNASHMNTSSPTYRLAHSKHCLLTV